MRTLGMHPLAITWFSILMAAAFGFPNWLANAVMIASTCFALSLILLTQLLKLERGRYFAIGALPPILVAMSKIPGAVPDLPGVSWRSLVISASDPFASSGYSNYFREAIAMHLLAAVIGYCMLVVASFLHSK